MEPRIITKNIDPSKNPNNLTRIDEGYTDACNLITLPGKCDEHLLFKQNKYGRKTKEEFEKLANDIEANGMKYPVTVFIEDDGHAAIWEGNHRLRAAASKNILVYVEIRYFGKSYTSSFICD